MKKALILMFVFTLASCATNIKYNKYTPPQDADLVKVKFIALDDYRNNDRVSLSIATRNNCQEKVNLAEAAVVKTKGFFGADSYNEIHTSLPVGQQLNIFISNTSSGSHLSTRCTAISGIQFESNRKYTIEVNNWSSKKSDRGGFGCEFKAYQVDTDDKKISEVKYIPPSLPKCKN